MCFLQLEFKIYCRYIHIVLFLNELYNNYTPYTEMWCNIADVDESKRLLLNRPYEKKGTIRVDSNFMLKTKIKASIWVIKC